LSGWEVHFCLDLVVRGVVGTKSDSAEWLRQFSDVDGVFAGLVTVQVVVRLVRVVHLGEVLHNLHTVEFSLELENADRPVLIDIVQGDLDTGAILQFV